MIFRLKAALLQAQYNHARYDCQSSVHLQNAALRCLFLRRYAVMLKKFINFSLFRHSEGMTT